MTYCTITAGICAGCDRTFPTRSRGEPGRVCPDCNFPDVRENYDMTEHEGKSHYCWAYCARCHEKIVYRSFHWVHGDYDEDDLPEPLSPTEEDMEEEGVSLLWMSVMAFLAIGLAVL